MIHPGLPRQLVLDLGHSPMAGRSSFFTSPSNQAGLAAISQGADWPGNRLLLLGPEGAGKSHLAGIWASENGAALVNGASLVALDLPALGPLVAVDDADLVAGNQGAEAALFHLYNMTLAGGGRLLLTGRSAPGFWGIGLADLLSRLQSMAIAALDLPDDALLSAVLVKLFADRQIAVSPSLVSFLTARIERSIAAARDIVARLDQEALAKSRPISRALAAEVLDLD